MPAPRLYIGTAGWTIPREELTLFAPTGTHLQRYAGALSATEINSSFHRPHRRSTYERWAASVPDAFSFSVKLPKEITHGSRLVDVDEQVDDFLAGVGGLGSKLGCLLVQLPPGLAFDASVASSFFGRLRTRHPGAIVCEPRHPSWLEPEAEAMLVEHLVARVAADPDRPPGAGELGGWPDLRYYRLHGSPRIYYSGYSTEFLTGLAERLERERGEGRTVWCIFDNTAGQEAIGNALELARRMPPGPAE